jgi:hypothetical protein
MGEVYRESGHDGSSVDERSGSEGSEHSNDGYISERNGLDERSRLFRTDEPTLRRYDDSSQTAKYPALKDEVYLVKAVTTAPLLTNADSEVSEHSNDLSTSREVSRFFEKSSAFGVASLALAQSC